MNISVVIPLYNKKETVERSLTSVIEQTYSPKEIIIVNDGSTDGSERIVQSMGIDNLKIINQDNAGVSVARNKGVNEAEFEWIAFLDADDEWLPGYLESIRNMHYRFPNCNVISTAYSVVDQKGRINKIKLKKIDYFVEIGVMSNYFEVAASSNPPICSSAICVRKSALKEVGGFPVNIKSGEDLLMWALLALRNKIAYSKESMAYYHQQVSNIGSSFYRENDEDHVGEILEKNMILCDMDEIKSYKEYIARWYKSKASVFIEIGRNRIARKKIYSSWRYSAEKNRLVVMLIISMFPSEISKYLYRILR